jgi:hypothetical protein
VACRPSTKEHQTHIYSGQSLLIIIPNPFNLQVLAQGIAGISACVPYQQPPPPHTLLVICSAEGKTGTQSQGSAILRYGSDLQHTRQVKRVGFHIAVAKQH